MAWSEEELLPWIERRLRGGVASNRRSRRIGSPGSDAAVVAPPAGERLVSCCDQTVEGVHFEPQVSARLAGRKAARRALSDLAATAARPLGLLLAVRAPSGCEARWLRDAIGAVAAASEEVDGELLGGDLCCAPGPRSLTVTALGSLTARRRPPARDRARTGQLVLLTGPTGGSRAGRHLRFSPRLAEGRFLHAAGATAMMDVSDGLARDLARLARASGVALALERVPVHRDAVRAARTSGRSGRDHALSDGEDHELIATIAPRDWEAARDRARRRFPRLEVVGRVRRGSGLEVPREDGTGLEPWSGTGGWTHGG